MEEAKPIIIPTRFKAKISHELSFPIGAERVSKALSDTPQILSLVLHFNSDRWGHVRFRRYACIRIARSSRRAEMLDKYLDTDGVPLFNEWQIEVSPVPRIHRHRIQEHIIALALPTIKDWLHKRAQLQQPGEETLTFFFDEEKDEFTTERETHLHPQRN